MSEENSHKMWVAMWGGERMPKRHGTHPEKFLSAMKVRALATPGRYGDGNGLYLLVDEKGTKRG